MKGRLKLALALIGLSAFAVVSQAGAERSQKGNVIVSLAGGIVPRTLPRTREAPVSVQLQGGVRTSDASPLPRVNRLKLELGWRGKLNTQGLPICPVVRLQGRSTDQVAVACGDALVGRGKLHARIFVPGQPEFGVGTRLLAFNGRTKVGRRAVLIHAYTSDPPISFVIPVGTWPHVARFSIDVGRRFRHDGGMRSYLNASCPIPEGFTAGFLSFARATYTFAGGDEQTTESVRGCRAKKNP
jgi:hypothetical protein